MTRHGVERIGDREDARTKWDLVTYEAVRISAPVPAFVVRAHDLEPFALQEDDTRQHCLAEDGVRLHLPPLRRAERAGHLEDPVGNPDLADVVKKEPVRRAPVAHDCSLADGLSESRRVALHALRVRASARVLRLQRTCERRDRLEVCALQELALGTLDPQHVPQVAGVEQQLLVRPLSALLRGPEGNAQETARQSLRNGEQLERTERLAHERVGSRLLRGCFGAALRAGQEHDRDVTRGRRSLQLGTELEAARPGHVDVEHDHVRPGAPDLPPRSSGVFGFDHGYIGDLERRLQQGAKCRIIVYQQDPQRAVPPFPGT